MAAGFTLIGFVLHADGQPPTYEGWKRVPADWEWTVGTPMAEWALTYLIVVGVAYVLIRMLGGGRLRAFFRWFWRGSQEV
jgi:hypothetical protein